MAQFVGEVRYHHILHDGEGGRDEREGRREREGERERERERERAINILTKAQQRTSTIM